MKLMVNSLPKSGTHLITKLLNLSGYSYSGVNFSSSNVNGKHKIIKRLVRGCHPFSMTIDTGLDISSIVRKKWLVNGMRKTASMQYMGGHFPYSDQMKKLLEENEIKIIYMMRDPRDVILSWAHYVPKVDWHYGKEGLIGKSLDEQVLLLLYGYRSGDYDIEGFRHILHKIEGWITSDDICLIRFEDLVGAKGVGSDSKQEDCIDRVLKYLGHSDLKLSTITNDLFGGTKTFRKGAIGSWKEEISEEVSLKIDEQLGDILARLGYEY